ncbi:MULTISPECIES: DGQHR domain-containing protein [unclassified Mesorhizobium]|uniref:DGQHR domain-containing protein n=1 Tax=unclassified Mesorhizobium TaxID=325217 RepID=UPI00333989A2
MKNQKAKRPISTKAKAPTAAKAQVPAKPKTAPKAKKAVVIPAVPINQGKHTFYYFTMLASQLYKLVQINRRSEDKREGYQRALSPSRVRGIARYIMQGGIVPGAIVVSFDAGSFDINSGELRLPNDENIGWVIDGQHRLAGAFEATEEGVDVSLPVVAFLGAAIEEQVELFITINREARGVPASLYIDLLKDLPRRKTEKEVTDERIADIARRLNTDESSVFFQRLIFTRNAKAGEISLVNFARVLRPHIVRQSGALGLYTQPEQEGAINNYFRGIATSFPKAWDRDIFFRTIGFGGAWRAFPLILNLALTRYKAFSVSAITKVFAQISDFDFEAWTELGSGSGAEVQAGDDLIESIQEAFTDDNSSIVLKLE